MQNRRNISFTVVAIIFLLLDQLTKYWIVHNVRFRIDEIEVIPGFFSIVHAQNPGAAFGMFGGFANRHVLFGIFTVIALGVVFDMLRKVPRTDLFMPTALGLVVSGAIGNAIDRVRGFLPIEALKNNGKVTDFLRVYTDNPSAKEWLINNFGTYEWPTFNVADIALVVGVCMFVIHYFFLEESKPEEVKPKQA